MDRKPSLQSTLHKPKLWNSATQNVTQNVPNRQYYSHKCGHQYIHNNTAPYTHQIVMVERL